MTARIVDVRQLMVNLVRQLKSQHCAGITPTFGQVDELFDLAERLALDIRLGEPMMPCSLPSGCPNPATHRVGSGSYCSKHAEALRAVTTLVEADAPNIALARLADMERGRAPWPAAVRELAVGLAQ